MFRKFFLLVLTSVLSISVGFGCMNLPVKEGTSSPKEGPKQFRQYSKSFVKIEFILSDEKKIPLWVGSGAYISKTVLEQESHLVLTAAHVCKLSPSMKMDLLINHGIDTSQYDKIVKIKSEEFDTTGKVVKIDRKNDICIVKTKKSNPPLVISENEPKYGTEYFNIAAPSGVYGRKMNLIYEGYYSGEKELNKVKRDFYTIPVTGGSSGSPIINKHGEVIGVVSMGLTTFEDVSISPRYDSLINFLYSPR